MMGGFAARTGGDARLPVEAALCEPARRRRRRKTMTRSAPPSVILSGARSAKSKDPVRRQLKTFGKEPMPA